MYSESLHASELRPSHHPTIDAARLHDKIIATAFHRIVGSESGSLAQRERALPLAAGAAAGEPRRHPWDSLGTHHDGEEHPRCGVGWHMGARVHGGRYASSVQGLQGG